MMKHYKTQVRALLGVKIDTRPEKDPGLISLWVSSTSQSWLKGGLTLLVVLLLALNYAQAQVVISGTVADGANGSPLPGVTVLMDGKTGGTVTDFDGNFKLNAEEGDVLIFSFIGYLSQRVTVGSQTIIDVELAEDSKQLDEVVVTALGIERETKSLGYSVSQVDGDNLSRAKEVNVVNSLSGKVAGVDVNLSGAGPTGSSSVTIRGKASLGGSNEPLYVIDGVPMDNRSQGEGAGQWGGYDLGDGVSSLNSDDIESVSVLKGPSAAALYGSRASNGVILITTKKGRKRNGIGVEFTSNATFEKVSARFDDYQTVYGQGRDGQIPDVDDAQNTTQSAWGAKMDPNLTIPIYNGQLKPYGVVEDNILDFFRTGSTFTNTVALTGGSEIANMRVSVSDMRNKDIIPGSEMARNTFLVNGSLKLADRLTITSKVNYIRESATNRPALSDNPNNVGLSLIGLAPSFDQKWLSEDYKDDEDRYVDWNGGNIYRINPYWSTREISNESSRDRIIGYLQVDYRLTDWLNLNLRGGTDFYQSRFTNFSPVSTPTLETGSLTEQSRFNREDNYQAMLEVHKDFNGGFSLSSYVGGNIMTYNAETFNQAGTGIILEDVQTIQNFLQVNNGYSNVRKQINSLFGAVQLGYKDTYFLDATLRNDWSSSLDPDYNSYMYPSLSGSFVFSNLLESSKFLSFGKLRASYAEVGGDTEPYRLSQNYGVKDFSLLGKPLGELSGVELAKVDLKPTRTYSYEVGADIRFFQDRLRLDAAYYYQLTRDQILTLNIPATSGYDIAVINAGEILNQGVEIQMAATPIQVGDFQWNVTVNFAKNVNSIPVLHPESDTYLLSNARWANAAIVATEGGKYGDIVGKKWLRDPDGNIVHNAAGLPVLDDEAGQQVLGNGQYEFTTGIINDFSYKGFTLRALIDYKSGADVYSMSSGLAYANGTSKETLEGRDAWYASEEARLAAGVTDIAAWTPTGGYVGKGVKNTGTADNPVYETNDIPTNPQNYWGSLYTQSPELFIYDASYVKLRELVIGYSFPKKWLGNILTAGSISFVGRNLWLIYSNVPNVDPESGYNNSNGQGFEYGSIPSRRSYGVNLSLKF
ncbi:TonB-linked outer membrane protein, SusC/RagA family [Reichenbachiella agariperforans]|uniref:TonB-linked outer membrane protein, SusC/RagA family n=1 Tax=Reichenbachiella agariperforans TaxID=156994 RepID=A0A1M6V6F4_REIAG|nr:SusC/RagA family TonB-linked outer membrane protein [Reichenbachiella agariperforans]SHK77053.1 TonB-linked outer membrane protein, SusC/RagA family [Reichenbachiella agariperforans]